MGKPKGYVVSEEERAKVRETIRRTLEERPPWTALFGPIKNAADTGNRREAYRLLKEYMDRKQEAALCRSPRTAEEP